MPWVGASHGYIPRAHLNEHKLLTNIMTVLQSWKKKSTNDNRVQLETICYSSMLVESTNLTMHLLEKSLDVLKARKHTRMMSSQPLFRKNQRLVTDEPDESQK